MTYKDYLSAAKEIDQGRERNWHRIYAEICDIDERINSKIIDEKTGKAKICKLYETWDGIKNKYAHSKERLKMNFAKQDAPAKIGDIIWSGQKVLRVEDIRLASFEYPMLKYFGTQLTIKGLPCKNQKKHPEGGIYQKDISSVNGFPYHYKTRE
jgi:hypothetical protein